MAVLDVHICYCWLDDILRALYSHIYSKDYQQFRYLFLKASYFWWPRINRQLWLISLFTNYQFFLGQYSPAICLIIASYTGCNRVVTVGLLTLGVGLNGGIYSGFKINHLDITPRFAGILMAFTNCTANLAGLLAPIVAGNLIEGKVSHSYCFLYVI